MSDLNAPDAQTYHNPDPAYLRELIARIGLSQREIARRLGINESTFRKYLTYPERASYMAAPYLVQLALECWAEQSAGRSRR